MPERVKLALPVRTICSINHHEFVVHQAAAAASVFCVINEWDAMVSQ